jgi:hypothetical protein
MFSIEPADRMAGRGGVGIADVLRHLREGAALDGDSIRFSSDGLMAKRSRWISR